MSTGQIFPDLEEQQAVNATILTGIDRNCLAGNGQDEVIITYRSEFALYDNSVGVVIFDSAGNFGEVRMVFPRVNDTQDNGNNGPINGEGPLTMGDEISLGVLGDGEQYGLFLVQDGFNDTILGGDISGLEFQFVNPTTGDPANISDTEPPELQFRSIGSNDPWTKVGDPVFHTADATAGDDVNPLNVGGTTQAIIGDDSGTTVVAFEDDARGTDLNGIKSDSDFNDAVFEISFRDVPDPDFTVTKVADVDTVDEAGDLISYTIVVDNTGDVDLTGITVNDTLIALSGPMGDDGDGVLETFETWTYTGQYEVTQDDINAGGTIDNTVIADTDQTPEKSDVESVDIIQDPNFIVTKEADPTVVTQSGTIVDYTITVENTGNVDLNNVVADDPLLGGDLGDPDSGDDGDGVLETFETWVYSGTYEVTQADINAGDPIPNTVTVTTDEAGSREASALVDLSPTAVITIDKVGDIAMVDEVGDIINYTITVDNDGDVDLTNVIVSDSLIGLTGPSGDDGDGILETFETWIYSGQYEVTQDDLNTGGTIDNTATATSDQAGPVSDVWSVDVIQNPDFVVTKDADPLTVMMAGEQIDYTIVVDNTGNIDLTVTSIVDSLIALAGPTGDDGNDLILGVDEVWTFTGTYTVTSDDIANLANDNDINNTVTVTTDEAGVRSAAADVLIENTAPTVSNAATTLCEENLSNGTNPNAGALAFASTVGIQDAQNNAAIVSVTVNGVTDDTVANGDTFAGDFGSLQIIDIMTGEFVYTLTTNSNEHNVPGAGDTGPQDAFSLGVSDGEFSETATVLIDLKDDAPTIDPIAGGIVDFADGDMVMNDINFEPGADGAELELCSFEAAIDIANLGTLTGLQSGNSVTYSLNGVDYFSFTLDLTNDKYVFEVLETPLAFSEDVFDGFTSGGPQPSVIVGTAAGNTLTFTPVNGTGININNLGAGINNGNIQENAEQGFMVESSDNIFGIEFLLDGIGGGAGSDAVDLTYTALLDGAIVESGNLDGVATDSLFNFALMDNGAFDKITFQLVDDGDGNDENVRIDSFRVLEEVPVGGETLTFGVKAAENNGSDQDETAEQLFDIVINGSATSPIITTTTNSNGNGNGRNKASKSQSIAEEDLLDSADSMVDFGPGNSVFAQSNGGAASQSAGLSLDSLLSQAEPI